MALDPSIYAQFRPEPQPSPFQGIAQLMALRGQTSEIMLRQAQIEEQRALAQQNQLKAEQDRRNLAGEARLQELMGDPEAGPKIAAGDVSPLLGQVPESIVDRTRTNIANVHEKEAMNSKVDLENKTTAYSALAEGLQALGSDVPTINANLQAFKANPANQVLFKNAGIDPSSIPTINNISDLDKWETAVRIKQAVTNKALALKEQQGKTAKEEAEARKTTAEAGIQEAELAGMSQAPGTAEQRIGGIIDPNKYPKEYAAYLSQYNSALKLADKTAVLKEAQAEMSKIREATNPEIRAGKVADAVEIAKGTSPITAARELNVFKQETPIRTAEALKVASANRAETGAEKLDVEYNNAKSAADSVARVLDLAESGNKAAGANVPLVGVGALNAVNNLRRINAAEIRQYGTAGSLLDRIQGKLQGWTEGQPIPKDVLDDMRTMHNELGKEAYQKYTTGLHSLEQRSGAKLQPTIAPPAERIKATHTLNGRGIGIDPKTNKWVYVDDHTPAQ